MKRIASSSLVLLLAATGGMTLALSCRDGGDPGAAATAAQWAAIEREGAALDDLRAALSAARASPSSSVAVADLETRTRAATDGYHERLVDFLNQHAGASGGAAPAVQAAIRAKSAEDVLVAREHIEGAGDYAKAIDILAAARAIDPDNPDLQAAQAEAERRRFVDAESFGRVEKGMSEDEVRAELGQVKPQNVRPSEEGLVAWLYPRAQGAAAAIFFRRGPDGSLAVVDTNYEAVPSAAERAPGEASRAEAVPD